MKTINLVTVSPETRIIIKKQVISLIKKGKKQIEIAETVGISPQAVKRISSAYKKEGTACLKEKKRGRKLGEKRLLTPAQEKEIYHILIDKSPDQMKLSFMLWTRAADNVKLNAFMHETYPAICIPCCRICTKRANPDCPILFKS